MTYPSEMVIARCNVVGAAGDPNYRQTMNSGRHALVADERPSHGGADAGPTPLEYLIAALGACTSITLRMYAERKGWNLGEIAVSLSLHKTQEGHRIERRVKCSLPLAAEQQTRLAEICEKTPVTLLVKSGVAMNTTVTTAQS